MPNIKYIVKRKFKYGKTRLVPGDEFIPSGGKFDEGILKSNLVSQNLDEFQSPARLAFKRGKLQRQGKQKLAGQPEVAVQLEPIVKAKTKRAHKANAGGE